MNETISNLISRRSIRSYKPDMVSDGDLQMIVDAGLNAASGMGRQPTVIVEIKDRETRDRLSGMNAKIMGSEEDPFYGAPVVFVVLADKDVPTHVYDGSLVLGNMMAAAHSLGLGSCWIHRAKEEFESEEGKELLQKWGIPGNYEGIGHLIVGYTDQKPGKREIRPGRLVKVE